MQTCDFWWVSDSLGACISGTDLVYMFCVATLAGTILEVPPVQWMEG